MISFQKLSIRHKLVTMLFLVAVTALFIGLAVHVWQDVEILKKDQAEGAAAMARVIGDYCVVDIVFDDPEAAQRTLSKLVSDQSIECACLYESHGELFASFARPGYENCPDTSQLAPVDIQDGRIIVSEPVIHQQKTYGRISLFLSSEPLQAKIRNYITTLLLLTAGLLVLSFVLALRLQNVISKPILNLADTTRKISQSKDYSLRVQKVSEDEIGVLSDEFNSLLSQVEQGRLEQEVAEQALRESENRYRILVESSPQAVYLEQEGHIIYANHAALRLYGCHSQADLQGIGLTALFPNWDAALKKHKSGPLEHALVRSDGTSIPVEISFIVTVFKGKTAMQVLAWDITESRNMRMAAERVQRLAALGEFSAILAHEIRNSLGAIALNMKTLSERLEIPDQYRKTFSNMELGMQRIQDIIKGILDFARPAPPSLRRVRLHRVLDNSIHAMESELDRASVTLVRDYDPNDPEVSVDPGQIGQVFVNLLLNARRAMEVGGRITISTRAVNSLVEVKVADTGKGIAPENLKRIFDPFFTTTPSGAGLGLAFVSRILEQHGAPIFVDSKLNEGTVFTIHFSTDARV